MAGPVVLVDTNVVFEAIRAGIWPAITGSTQVETVEECLDEARRGDGFSSGRVTVTESDLARFHQVHPVDDTERAALLLSLPDVELDEGERDLLAHCLHREEPPPWVLISPDRAAVRGAVGLGWEDRVISLEEVATGAGCQPAQLKRLRSHFRRKWLSDARTDALLRGPF